MILVVGFLSMSGTISLFWFKIPSSAKSTPDIEKKKKDFHLQFVVVAVEVVVVIVMVMVTVVVAAIAFYY